MSFTSTPYRALADRLNSRHLDGGGLCVATLIFTLLGVEHVFRPANEPGAPNVKAGVIVVLSSVVFVTIQVANRRIDTEERFRTATRVGIAFGVYGCSIAVLIMIAHAAGTEAALDLSFTVAMGGLAGLAAGVPIGGGYVDLSRERRTAERRKARLRNESQRLEILYRVARHNIRTEANIILGYADLIESSTEHEATRNHADTVRVHAERLESISKHARQLRRIWEAEGETIETPVHSFTDRALSSSRFDGCERLTLALDDDVTVASHPFAHWALEEAVDNAFAHNGSDTTVTVRTENRDGYVRVSVEDDGAGIPPIEAESLGTVTESQLTHGQGLGMQVIYWATEGAGASLSITNRESGGTTVAMEFPTVRSGRPESARSLAPDATRA